ncbi:MAG: ThiF family adenylyltransferase, partial [Propionibacteriaceae bacterium]|nr:ThiF family adenylyltransferase [Propionibacteriaceae bacterium]
MSPLSRDPDRDARHLALPDFGEAELSKLQQAIVVVIGAGGLGAPVLTYLAASGVGTLRIVDDDVVEASNLARQVLFRPVDLGQSKAHLAGRRVGEINPDVHWEAYSTRFTA